MTLSVVTAVSSQPSSSKLVNGVSSQPSSSSKPSKPSSKSTTSTSSSNNNDSSSSSSSSSSYFPINKDAPILSKEVAKKCVLLGNKRLKRSGILDTVDVKEVDVDVDVDVDGRRRRPSSDDTDTPPNPTIIKTLTHSDLVLGECIGQGSFSNVYNVKALVKQESTERGTQQEGEEEELDEDEESTLASSSSSSLSSSTLASSSSSLSSSLSFSLDANQIVIKVLRKKLINTPRMFAACVGDIYKESLILQTLNHTNIVKVHAVGSSSGDGSINSYKSGRHDAFFIVLDKLSETLSDKLKVWKQQKSQYQQQQMKKKKKTSSITKKLFKLLSLKSRKNSKSNSKSKNKNPQKKLVRNDTVVIDDDHEEDHEDQQQQMEIEQSMAVIQLAEALRYIHSKRMIHRDIKPDNIGFDINLGQLKLFDFDVSRMLPTNTSTTNTTTKGRDDNDPPTSDDDDNDDDSVDNNNEILYKMTRRIGSPRYMSPECGCGYKYNSKTDVYSFGLVVYEIFSLLKPYDDLPSELHEKLVFINGIRPKIPKEWGSSSFGSSSLLPNLVERCWSSNINIRPTMEEILYEIKEVQQVEVNDNDDNDDSNHGNGNGNGELLLLSSNNDDDDDDDRRLVGSLNHHNMIKKSLSSSGRTTATTILTL